MRTLARGVCAAGLSAVLVPATALAGTVKYDLNGPAGVVHEHADDGDVTVENITVDFDGLGDITGWNTKSDGTGTAYKEGDKVSGDATLYAQYSDGTRLASEDSGSADGGSGGDKADDGSKTDAPASFAGLALGDDASAGKLAALSSDRLASLESAVKQYVGAVTEGTLTVQSATDDEATLTITANGARTKATFKHNSDDGWSVSDVETDHTDDKTTPDSETTGDGDTSKSDDGVDTDTVDGSKDDGGGSDNGSSDASADGPTPTATDSSTDGSAASSSPAAGSPGTSSATSSSSMPSTGYARAALGLIPAGLAAAAAGGVLSWRAARKKKAVGQGESEDETKDDEDDGVYIAED